MDLRKIKKLIDSINNIELETKKNFNNSILITTNFILEKGNPSLITTPLIPLSLISKFEPAPSIVNFNLCCLFSFKNSISCSLFLGLKK